MITYNKSLPAHLLFDTLFNSPSKISGIQTIPSNKVPYNIIKEENGFLLEFAIPGFSKDDFTVRMEDQKLLVKLEKEHSDERTYLRKEFDYSSFEKKFNLPEDINAEKISASYEHGVLTISLEKLEKISKQIDIH